MAVWVRTSGAYGRYGRGKTILICIAAGAAAVIIAMLLFFVVITLPAIGVELFMRWFLGVTAGLAAP